MNNILVTGGAGFLGFHLARTLARRPDTHVTVVDSFVRGERDSHFAALVEQPNVTSIEADLSSPDAVASLPRDIDYVYHLAALNGTQNFYERPMDVIRCSTIPNILLAEHYGRHAKLKRFVYAGTSESYASTVTRFNWAVPTAEDVVLSIDNVMNPRWSYAASKMHGEIVTAQAGRSFGMPFTIIRFHNAYGPRMGDRHVVPDFYMRARKGRYELFGYEDTRSFIYVDDAIRATLLCGETPDCRDEIVNIGGCDEITILDLGKTMMRVRHMEGEIIEHASMEGSVRRRAPDLAKLHRLTGFRQEIPLAAGLAATAAFYLDDTLVEAVDVAGMATAIQ